MICPLSDLNYPTFPGDDRLDETRLNQTKLYQPKNYYLHDYTLALCLQRLAGKDNQGLPWKCYSMPIQRSDFFYQKNPTKKIHDASSVLVYLCHHKIYNASAFKKILLCLYNLIPTNEYRLEALQNSNTIIIINIVNIIMK